MTTADDGGAPLDPEYAKLFRDEPLPVAPQPAPAGHADAEPAAALPADGPDDEPPAADPAADTGRLFRSRGVDGHDEAVLALSSDHFGRLRTLRRDDEPVDGTASAGPGPEPEPVAGAAPDRTSVEPAIGPDDDLSYAPLTDDDAPAAAADPAAAAAPIIITAAASPEEDPTPASRFRRSGGHRSRAITAGAGYVVVFGVTLVVGFLNAWLGGGELGWPTGLALLVSSTYVALTIRREDSSVAVIAPPLAFAVTALTAGQVFLGTSANSLLNRAVVWFFALADNWPWIIGSTVLALVIVLVRARRR